MCRNVSRPQPLGARFYYGSSALPLNSTEVEVDTFVNESQIPGALVSKTCYSSEKTQCIHVNVQGQRAERTPISLMRHHTHESAT